MRPKAQHLDFTGHRPFIARQIVNNENAIPYHLHQTYELLHIVEGEGRHCMGNQVGNFQAGDLYLIAPGLPHRFVSHPPSTTTGNPRTIKSTILHFKKDCFGKKFLDLPENWKLKRLLSQEGTSLRITNPVKSLIIERMDAMAKNKDEHQLMKLLWIFSLLSDTNTYKIDEYALLNTPHVINDPRIISLLAYVEANIARKISIETVAQQMNMSVATFCRLFKTYTSLTFFEYLNKKRIRYACELMADSKLSIRDIMSLSGFSSSSNFINQFKQFMHCTPREYRKQRKELYQ